MRFRVPGLELDRLVVDSRGPGVRLRLGPVCLCRRRVRSLLRPALGLALVLPSPLLALTGALRASAHLESLIMISHTCRIPFDAERNQRRPPM